MAKPRRKAAPGDVATNRQASHRFNLMERFECGITLTGVPHSGAGKHDYFVQLRPRSALCASAASGFDRKAGRRSNVVGAYPKHEADHRTALYSTALVRR